MWEQPPIVETSNNEENIVDNVGEVTVAVQLHNVAAEQANSMFHSSERHCGRKWGEENIAQYRAIRAQLGNSEMTVNARLFHRCGRAECARGVCSVSIAAFCRALPEGLN